MFTQNINPDILVLGPFSIRFYGIVYALGFLLVGYLLSKKWKEEGYDLATWIMIGGLIGGRLYHVITDFSLYRYNLLGMFAIWRGGLGFIGGIVGAIIAIYIYCKKKDIDPIKVMDIIVVPLPLVVGFGRIANYINSEHVGPITDVPWCVVFEKVDGACRHPTQLYQALAQFIFFGVMYLLSKRIKKKGRLTLAYIIGYGVVRFVTDFWRLHPLRFMGLMHTQILGIAMIIFGIYMWVRR